MENGVWDSIGCAVAAAAPQDLHQFYAWVSDVSARVPECMHSSNISLALIFGQVVVNLPVNLHGP